MKRPTQQVIHRRAELMRRLAQCSVPALPRELGWTHPALYRDLRGLVRSGEVRTVRRAGSETHRRYAVARNETNERRVT